MFGFFKKNLINKTDQGSHGDHWMGLFDEIDEQRIIKYFQNSFEFGKCFALNENTIVTTNNLVRTILYKGGCLSGFPYCKGSRFDDFKVNSIIEWTHVANLEAVIKVTHISGCGIAFFATDYSFNKKIYKKQKNISVNLTGLIYKLTDFNLEDANKEVEEFQFSNDFCGYSQVDKDIFDTIEFIGIIQSIKEFNLIDVPGFMITMKITPDFNLDMFIAKDNLKISLQINQHVSGCAWIQGTLEQE